MKIAQKVLVVFLIAVCVFAILPTISSNAYDVSSKLNEMSGDANISDENIKPFTDIGNKILTFLQILSGIAAVVMIAITGFRYIVETPEVKGELKKNMVPIVIGIILVFFAVSIAKFFLGIAGSGK